jgi:two-component system response regulator DegU
MMMVDGKTLRIAIVTEQRIMGEALAGALAAEPGFDVVADTPSVDAWRMRALRTDIVLFDLDGARIALESAVLRIREADDVIRVIVMSARWRTEALRRTIDAHADGHVMTDTGLDELKAALRCVAQGARYVDPRLAGSLLFGPRAGEPPPARLSPREREVLSLIAAGRVNRDIGKQLNVSLKTVKNHVSNIFSKLETTSRTEAAIHAIRSGMV